MRPQAPKQVSGACDCAHNLAAAADLLRQALALLEGPRTYEAGIAQWHATVQAHQQRTERPRGGER